MLKKFTVQEIQSRHLRPDTCPYMRTDPQMRIIPLNSSGVCFAQYYIPIRQRTPVLPALAKGERDLPLLRTSKNLLKY